MRKQLVPVVAILALLVALSACGDDDGGSVFGDSTTTAVLSTTTEASTTTTVASTTTVEVTTTAGDGGSGFGAMVADALTEGAGADSAAVTGGEEECLTSTLSQAIGAERFAELDALASTATDMSVVFNAMSDPELDAMVGAITTCIDVQAMLTAEMESAELSPEAVACFAGTISQQDTLKAMILAMMSGQEPEANPEFIALMVRIMTEDCVEPMEDMLVEQFVAGGISEEGATCIADRFLRGGLFEGLLDTMLSGTDFPSDPELQNQMMTVFTECLTPEELENLGS